MLISNNTIAFVKLHPVKVKATTKVDAVEVVRCNKCKYFWGYESEFGKCMESSALERCVHIDDYCSYGERKEK